MDAGYVVMGKKGVRSSGVCVRRWFEGGADVVVFARSTSSSEHKSAVTGGAMDELIECTSAEATTYAGGGALL